MSTTFGKTSNNGQAGNSTNLTSQQRQNASRANLPVGSKQGPIMHMQIDLRELGRDRAIANGALKVDKPDLQVLQEHAESMARETWRAPYDPATKPQDRMREEEYAKNLADRIQIEDSLKHSAAEIREKEEALAKVPIMDKPQPPMWLMWAVCIGTAATIAPTLHDYLVASMEDSLLAWLFAAGIGTFVGWIIAWGILGSIAAVHRTVRHWIGLGAGFIVSIALGVVRLSTATSTEETMMALGLTLFEFGLVVMADWVASGLRRQFSEWKERQTEHDQARRAFDAACSEHARRRELLDDVNGRLTAHVEYVEDLHLRNVNLDELIAVAVKAVTDGYYQGIANNIGKVVRAGGAR